MRLKKENLGGFIFSKIMDKTIEIKDENIIILIKEFPNLFENDKTNKPTSKSIRGNSKGEDYNTDSELSI